MPSGPATLALKTLIATELAAGHSLAEIAERHNYTPRAMARLSRTPQIQELVKQQQEVLLGAAERTMFRFMLAMDKLGADMVEDAYNSSSPRQFEARKYIMDRILPTRSTSQGGLNVNLQVTREVVAELGQAMKALGHQRPITMDAVPLEESLHLHEGKSVFADEADPLPDPDGDPTQ
jgi:hypothetical protein